MVKNQRDVREPVLIPYKLRAAIHCLSSFSLSLRASSGKDVDKLSFERWFMVIKDKCKKEKRDPPRKTRPSIVRKRN